jgi:hypothetical protein
MRYLQVGNPILGQAGNRAEERRHGTYITESLGESQRLYPARGCGEMGVEPGERLERGGPRLDKIGKRRTFSGMS